MLGIGLVMAHKAHKAQVSGLLTDLKNYDANDIFIEAIVGLSGFKDATRSVFPQVEVQHCIVHQIHNSPKYIT